MIDADRMREAANRLTDKHGKPIWQTDSDGEGCFHGFTNADRHRTCGKRAWCTCGEWCYPYPDMACACCGDHVVTRAAADIAALLRAIADASYGEGHPAPLLLWHTDVWDAALVVADGILGGE